jgi:arylmalonate decarboxylase
LADVIDRLKPRYIWGDISPRESKVQRGPSYQFYRIVPNDVMLVVAPLGIRDYTPERVEEAIANFWDRVESVKREKADHLILGGAPVSAQLGRQRVQRLLREAEDKTGIPGDAPIEAVIAAMKHLGLKRIAVGSRWADELNARVRAYLEEGGLEVVGITSRGQWASEAFGMSFEEGLQTAIDVGREAAQIDPRVDAVWVAGGAAFALHTIPAIEAEFGKPTFTNLSAEIWHGLVHPKVIDPVKDWGTLLATP